LIPEPIAVAQARELILQDRENQLADEAAVDVIFGESADPEIDILRSAIARG
jgi:hypothetical protein